MAVVWRHLWTVFTDDWRGRVVGIAVLLAATCTILFPIVFRDALDATKFIGAAYASWSSGFVLFVLTGFVISIVTLSRPEQDVFENRARNFLLGQKGAHIDYMVPKLRKVLEPYCDDLVRTMTIVRYHAESQMFLVNQDTELTFRSYVSDVPSDFESQAGYTNASLAPGGEDSNCLVFLRVEGKDVGGSEPFEESILRPFAIHVAPRSSCKVHYRMTFWVRENEPNRQRFKRFTRKTRVIVHNQLSTRALEVTQPANPSTPLTIPAGTDRQVVSLIETQPHENGDDVAYDFRLNLG